MKTATQIIEQWFEQVWNNSDGAYIDRLLADNVDIIGLSTERITTPAGFHDFFTKFNIAFTAIQAHIERMISQDNAVSGIVHFKAKHRRSGVITQFKVSFHGLVENEKIVELKGVLDFLGILTQINVLDADILEKHLY